MPERLDVFIVFRTVLFVALTCYYGLTAVGTIVHIWRLLRGSDPRRRLLREVIAYLLASIRLRPLATELAQIALLILVLVSIWRLHPV